MGALQPFPLSFRLVVEGQGRLRGESHQHDFVVVEAIPEPQVPAGDTTNPGAAERFSGGLEVGRPRQCVDRSKRTDCSTYCG